MPVPIILAVVGGALASVGLLKVVDSRSRQQAPQSFLPRPTSAVANPRAQSWEFPAYVRTVEKYIPGFNNFAKPAALRESNMNNYSHNGTDSERAAARKGFERNEKRFARNAWAPDHFMFGSGGWFGMLPSTGLDVDGWENESPYLVFHPAASMVMMAAMIRRITRGYFHRLPENCRNWLTIRRFMASNTVGMDCGETLTRSREVRERLEADMRRAGVDPRRMYDRVTVKSWPEPNTLFSQLIQSRPKVG